MQKIENGNIVKDFKKGNSRIKIADDYCRGKSQQDTQKILDRVAQLALQSFVAAASDEEKIVC